MLHAALLPDLQNLDLLSVAVTIAAMGVLGFAVLLENLKSITNRTFFYLSLAIIFWSGVNYAAYQFRSEVVTLLLLRLVMFFAVWFAFMVFMFLAAFPAEDKKFPRWFKFGFIPLAIITSIISLTPLVFREVAEMSPTDGATRVINGVGIILFGLTVLTFNVGGIISLFIKTLKTDKASRLPYQYVLAGIFITLALIVILNFILPAFFDNPRFIPLGAVFIFPFVAFTSFAILKHKLFNIKVAGTAVLVFLLSVVTFSEVILARDIALIIYRSSIFILVLSFGILLIRGVLREVEQREKLAVLNQKLQAAYEEVDRLSRAKSEFLSITSHQLKTSQTAIKGYLSMTLEGSYGPISEKVRTVLERTYLSNERLIRFIDDLLNVARIESGTLSMDLEETSLEELISSIVDEMRIKANEKKLYLNLEKPEAPLPKITIDPGKIRQVILNLIDNSLKYTEKGGVTVRAKLREVTDKYPQGLILVEIKDTGVGMSKEEIENIFGSFTRGRAGAKYWISGLGLGLYIAKKFTELHQGRIWAESAGEGKGSTFYVELPVK